VPNCVFLKINAAEDPVVGWRGDKIWAVDS